MKKITQILIFLFCMAIVKGQESVITMTTAKAVGQTVSFSLAASTNNTTIQVDFGDGTKVDKIIGTSAIVISGALVGSQTIKICGAGIKSIDCHSNQLTTLDVSNNTAIESLDCDYNQLTTLDVSNNIALTWLNCTVNQLTTLDVSSNTALNWLQCSGNQLTTLDLSNNISLIALYCNYNQLTTLDVRNNIALNYLFCHENQLITLDVSNNITLFYLFCHENQLTTLDISNSNTLMALNCTNNQLTFATLPLKRAAWITFNYAPQKHIFIGKEVNVGDEIDFNSQLTVNGNTTAYTWKTQGGVTLTEGVDYTITNGKTLFLKDQADSAYCEMTNATFPDFNGNNVLKTSYVKVLSGATSIESDKIEDNGLYIYPNPANNVINIEDLGLQNADISIYTTLGKLMLQQKIKEENIQVNISQFPKGVYMLQITNGTRKITRKIIKE